jgi:hypothetical protein
MMDMDKMLATLVAVVSAALILAPGIANPPAAARCAVPRETIIRSCCDTAPNSDTIGGRSHLRRGGLTMTDPAEFESALGLADFLSDLRAELTESSKRAQDETLKFGIHEVTVSLDIGVTFEKKGAGSLRASAKFWVFAKAEAGVEGELSSQRVNTQHITLTLNPFIEDEVVDASGNVHQTRRHTPFLP